MTCADGASAREKNTQAAGANRGVRSRRGKLVYGIAADAG